MTKSFWAKLLGWGQFAVMTLQQVSQGHFPQNRTEWAHLFGSFLLALALHHASSTAGTN